MKSAGRRVYAFSKSEMHGKKSQGIGALDTPGPGDPCAAPQTPEFLQGGYHATRGGRRELKCVRCFESIKAAIEVVRCLTLPFGTSKLRSAQPDGGAATCVA